MKPRNTQTPSALAAMLFLIAVFPHSGLAAPGQEGKGGDTCEMRIQEIIEGGPKGGGLKPWINDPDPTTGKVGPDDFRDEELFREGVQLNGDTRAERIADYITRMNAQIKDRKFFTRKQLEGITVPTSERLLVVECTKSEKPVEVTVNLGDLAQPEFRSFERVCWNSGGDDRIAQITCDREVFDRLNWDPKVNADLQYTLIHHEVAGLADIEGNFRYGLSRVVAEFMETREVEMLGRVRHPNDDLGEIDLMDIGRDSAGNIIHPNQYEADGYCRDHGSRLPTARELALWAVKHGAKISDHPQDGFYPEDGTDRYGRPDRFYFAVANYRNPYPEQWAFLDRFVYWSLSVDPIHHDRCSGLSSGFIDDDLFRSSNYTGYAAVVCVKVPKPWHGDATQ